MNQSIQIDDLAKNLEAVHNFFVPDQNASGLPVDIMEKLKFITNMSAAQVIGLLRIPKTTYLRRKEVGHFSIEESDRILRFIKALNKAIQVFDEPEHAFEWLQTKSPDLNGHTPYEYLGSEHGAREVEAVLDRIAYGVIF